MQLGLEIIGIPEPLRGDLGLGLALLVLDDDVDDDHEDDHDHEEQQPDVRQLDPGRGREGTENRGEKGGEHKESGDGAHEPVVEVGDIDEEGQVDQEPEHEGLEEGGDEGRYPDPLQRDGEHELAAGLRPLGDGRQVHHGEGGQDPGAYHRDRGRGGLQGDRLVVFPRQTDDSGAHLRVQRVSKILIKHTFITLIFLDS